MLHKTFINNQKFYATKANNKTEVQKICKLKNFTM